MEFTLDFPLIRDILEQEHARARDEIGNLGMLRALKRSQQRHDARIATAPDVGTLACREGCAWCCYFTVDVHAAEVFRILDFVEQSFTPEEKDRVYTEVRANGVVLRKLGPFMRRISTRNCWNPQANSSQPSETVSTSTSRKQQASGPQSAPDTRFYSPALLRR